MKDVDCFVMRVVHWTIPLLTIGIFVVDLLTPVGIAVSILYVVPLLLTVFRSKEQESLYFCGLATSLLWLGLFLKPPGSSLLYGVLNRTLGTVVLWILALGLIRFRRLQHESVQAERALMSERVERAHAEGLMMEAQQARYYADREAVRAGVGRKEAEGQLLVAQLRLESIIESAMDAIITVDEDQRVVLFNHAAEQMFGCSTQAAIGQPLDRFLPTRFRDVHRHHVQGFGQSGVTSRKMGHLGTVMGLRSNGEEFPIEAAISHIAVEHQKYYTVILRDITERKQAEIVLKETTERSQLLMQYAPVALAMLDRELRYLAVSQRWMSDYRLEGQSLIGKSHYEVFPEIPERWKIVHQRGLAGEVVRCEEDRFVRQDGTEQWLQWEVRPWYTIGGAVGGLVFFTEDITGRKRGEEALHESQRQLTTLISNLPGFVYRCRNDRDWTFEYLSEGVSDLTGYTVQEYLVQRSISYGDNTHPGDRERVWQEIQAAVAQRRPYETTYRILTRAGEVKSVWERGEGIYATDGRLSYLEGFVTDITERKRAEHLLRQSEDRYRRLIAVSPYAIVVIRGDRVLFANDQAIKLFGAVKAEEILSRSVMDLFLPDYHSAIRERIHELVEGRAQVPMLEEKIVTLSGRSVDAEVSAARFVDEEGPAILVMLRDISERKRLQEQLRKTERIAELGTVASGMAHEIGTPMNVILGRAEYLMDRVTDEPIKKGLQTIITQVERITRVMNQLLSFARRKTPERGALDLKQVVEDSLEMFHERLTRSQIQLELMLADPCPMVLADADQMSQVMINLVMNAVHAMPNGGTLRVALAPEPQMVRLTVADTGHGIPREVIKKIFDPFFTTKEFGKGTGLGLTVVKGIIEEHQGSIAVESQEGTGTTFTILLPMADNKT
ncbi:PAS domain S-box protein [Nitrospira sp. BLG_1]|uniref:PAS domain-containing sensor histidine kinase n=1 Tax=Nitrospira sp. BLG_1 TaxID=3395883 RepID=UPI0039BD2434